MIKSKKFQTTLHLKKTYDAVPFQEKIKNDLEEKLALRFCLKVITLLLYDPNDKG